MTSLPLFEHTKAALGYFTFEGANDLQIKKCKMFQKLDRNTFPMSYIGLRGRPPNSAMEWSYAPGQWRYAPG